MSAINWVKDIKIKLNVGTREIVPDLGKELSVSEAHINRDLSEQPAAFAAYATLYALARHEMRKYEAEYIATLREHYEKEGKKPTEKRLESELYLDEQYQDLKNRERVLRMIKDAFQQRKDMLISLASNLRAQGDMDLHVKMAAIRKKGK